MRKMVSGGWEKMLFLLTQPLVEIKSATHASVSTGMAKSGSVKNQLDQHLQSVAYNHARLVPCDLNKRK